MKPIKKLIIFFMLISNFCIAQFDADFDERTNRFSTEHELKIRKKINAFLKINKANNAINFLDSLINTNISETKKADYLIRKALVFHTIKDFDNARENYFKVLKNEKVKDLKMITFLGDFYFYANYKHICCKQIALTYQNQKKYNTAIQFYNKAITTYKFKSGSGSSMNREKVNIKKTIADLYLAENKVDMAIETLIPFLDNMAIYSNKAINKLAEIIVAQNLADDFFKVCNQNHKILIAKNNTKNQLILPLKNYNIKLNAYSFYTKDLKSLEQKADYYFTLFSSSGLINNIHLLCD